MLTCFIYRKSAASSLDGDTPLSERARFHLTSCPGCRAAYGAEREVGKRLASAAAQRLEPTSPFLHGRIMDRIERAEAAGLEPSPGAVSFLRPVAMILSCLILFTFLLWRTLPRHSPSAPPAQALAQDRKPLSKTLRASQARLAEWSGSIDQPLHKEMEMVATDAKTAVQFLSRNFLPEQVHQALRSAHSQAVR